MNKYFKHLKTITLHKFYVGQACFKAGIPWQGITHDLSKYGITEFITSARFFQGDKSPISAEKDRFGYSFAWQHHKGVNKHHWQYWIDWEHGNQYTIEMPMKYFVEMICDWVGAGKAYNKGKWTIDTFKQWYESHKDRIVMHKKTRDKIEVIMNYIECEKDIYTCLTYLSWAESNKCYKK